MKRPELSATQIQLLRTTYDAFKRDGDWPSMAFVDAMLDHEHDLDADEVLADMPQGVILPGPNFSRDSPCSLTAIGLSFLEEASDDLSVFVALLAACAHVERATTPDGQFDGRIALSSDDFMKAHPGEPSTEIVTRAVRIFQLEGLSAGSSGPDGTGKWTVWVSRNIRVYRDIDGIDDYIARRPEPLTAQRRATPMSATPFAFVLMPFNEDWSANVYDAITSACGLVAASFDGFRVERADDITEPGRITDQIVSAIERADVLVADITASNPNVMFELGYGDALRKPIIVLNQVVDDTPFDIRDWRQIIYSSHDLGHLRTELVDFLTGTLVRLGFSRTSAQ